jgi:hypothetical protein
MFMKDHENQFLIFVIFFGTNVKLVIMNIMNIHQTIQDIKQCQSANLWEINV